MRSTNYLAPRYAFQGTRRFITALTSVRHLSLSWVSPIQSIYPHPNSWRSILILSTHLRLGLPSGLLPSGFPTKTLYAPPLLTHTRHMPSPSHSSRFYHPHNIGWGVQIVHGIRIINQTFKPPLVMGTYQKIDRTTVVGSMVRNWLKHRMVSVGRTVNNI